MVYAKLVKIEFVILLFYGLLYTYSETALLQPPFAFLMIIGFLFSSILINNLSSFSILATHQFFFQRPSEIQIASC